MYITLYFIVTCLHGSLRIVRDHFLALDPTDLIVDLLEERLFAAETSINAVVLLTFLVLRWSELRLFLVRGAVAARAREARVEGVAAVEAVVEAVEAVEVAVVAVGLEASVAAVVVAVGVVVAVVAAVRVVVAAVVVVGVEPFRKAVLVVARSSSGSESARPLRPSTFLSGLLSVGCLGVLFVALRYSHR
ncbi:unnamed protein product [Closterium sp. NIES-64]|nr:unnamed protein product [Closterium sp. NIES-64]